MALVEATDVIHDFHRGSVTLRAVDRVSLRVEPGEFVALIGPSGSGKSTLLHILGGVLRPTSGAVSIEDRVLAGLSDDELTDLRRRRVGLVFQFFALLPALSAWENVVLPGLLDGTALRRQRTRAMELLDLVGLADRAEHRPAQLSGGELQRVAIARALLFDPPLVLADEPTGNLDSASGASVVELLRRCASQGGTRGVVMATHDPVAAASASRVLRLADGCLDGSIPAR